MSNPRPEQLGPLDESFVTSGGIAPDGSVIRAGSNLAFLLDEFVPQLAGGRLTIDDIDFEPVPTTDLTSKTELFYVPCNGVDISLYDGSKWVPHDFFPMLSVDNTGLIADRNYDVFVVETDGVLSLELVAWNAAAAGSGSRVTALAQQDGIWTLSTDAAMRYVGTVRTTSAGEFEDSSLHRFVWNSDNRFERVSIAKPNSTFVSGVASTDWTTAFSNPNLNLEFVTGLPTEVRVDLIASVEENANGRDSLCRATLVVDGVNSFGAFDYPVYYLDDSTPLWSHYANSVSTPDYYVVVPSFTVNVAGSVQFRTDDSFAPGGYSLVVLG